jgi:hypothetical protein
MEPIECSETLAFNIQTPGKYPEENLPYLQHGESLKTMVDFVTEGNFLFVPGILPSPLPSGLFQERNPIKRTL